MVCRAHGLNLGNLGLSNTRTFVYGIYSSCHSSVILT